MKILLVDTESSEVLESRILPAEIKRQDIMDLLERWLWRNHRITTCEECGHYFHEADMFEIYEQAQGVEQPPYLLCDSCRKQAQKRSPKGE